MQDGNSKPLAFKIPHLISYVSQFMTLLPGDIISTGTPAGVGWDKARSRLHQTRRSDRIGIDGLGSSRQKPGLIKQHETNETILPGARPERRSRTHCPIRSASPARYGPRSFKASAMPVSACWISTAPATGFSLIPEADGDFSFEKPPMPITQPWQEWETLMVVPAGAALGKAW